VHDDDKHQVFLNSNEQSNDSGYIFTFELWQLVNFPDKEETSSPKYVHTDSFIR
jgi:hypothetical protein